MLLLILESWTIEIYKNHMQFFYMHLYCVFVVKYCRDNVLLCQLGKLLQINFLVSIQIQLKCNKAIKLGFSNYITSGRKYKFNCDIIWWNIKGNMLKKSLLTKGTLHYKFMLPQTDLYSIGINYRHKVLRLF